MLSLSYELGNFGETDVCANPAKFAHTQFEVHHQNNRPVYVKA